MRFKSFIGLKKSKARILQSRKRSSSQRRSGTAFFDPNTLVPECNVKMEGKMYREGSARRMLSKDSVPVVFLDVAEDRCSWMISDVDMLSAQIYPNTAKLIVCYDIIEMDSDPKHSETQVFLKYVNIPEWLGQSPDIKSN